MRKLIALIFCFVLLAPSAFAENEIKNVNFNKDMVESDKIIYNQKSGSDVQAEKFTKEKDAYVKKGIDGSVQTPVISMGEKYKDVVINMEAEFDFTDAKGAKASFDGFILRAKDTDKVCWSTECYCVLIREDSVEIQVFAKGENKFLLNQKTQIPKNEKVNVSVGTVDTDAGVYVFLKINDKIYGALDKNNSITTEGYFNLEFRGGLKVYPIEKSEPQSISCATLNYDAKNSVLKAEVKDVIGKSENLTYKWFLSKEGKTLATTGLNDYEDIFEEIEGETNSELLLMSNDVGKYAYAEISDGTNVYNSEIIYVSPAEYSLEKDFITVVGYNKFINGGKHYVFDKENSNIYTDEKDGLCYIPIRAVADSFGWPVAWDGERRIVLLNIISSGTPDTEIQIGANQFRNIRNQASGALMEGVPYVKEGRTFIDHSAMKAVMNVQHHFYDEETGLLVISSKKLSYNKDEITDLVNAVIGAE